MLHQGHVMFNVRRSAYVVAAACTAIFATGCGQQAASLSPNHLASIQTAVTCPAPPAHIAATSPSHAYSAAPRQVIEHNVGYCAFIDTNRGVISVRLRPEHAPSAVNDFVYLAQHGFYDGLTFYQACPAITGPSCPAGATAAVTGDPSATGAGGPGYTVKADPVVGQYLFGAVAMYSTHPSALGSQLFISKGDSSMVARKYDIFGQVTDGIPALALLAKGDTILWIAVVPTAPEP
jgi:cyclophilin family peptidyl-prolyl cis-trans isomerase